MASFTMFPTVFNTYEKHYRRFRQKKLLKMYYNYQLLRVSSKIRRDENLGFNAQLLLLSRATCQPLTSVVAKRAKIAGDNIVTTGNTKILSPNSVAPYSTDNHSSSYVSLT